MFELVRFFIPSLGCGIAAIIVLWLRNKLVFQLAKILLLIQGSRTPMEVRMHRALRMMGFLKWCLIGVIAHYTWLVPMVFAASFNMFPESWGMPQHVNFQ